MDMSYFPPYIDSSGIHMPTYEDRLQDLCSAYRSIFGLDAELNPAVPDYQLLSVFAKALDDASAFMVAGYNSRNPEYASGQALDLLLPTYGLSRLPGETDAEARARVKKALASLGCCTVDAMEAEIRKVPNVTQILIRVNDENSTVDGIPAHNIAAYVNNGNAGLIANAIWAKKPPGIGTYGSVSRTVTDSEGNQHTVKFSRPVQQFLIVHVVLRAYTGFDRTAVENAIRTDLMNCVNAVMDIGEDLNVPQLYGRLYQAAGNLASTFAISDLNITSTSQIEEREKLNSVWNGKWIINSTDNITIQINS